MDTFFIPRKSPVTGKVNVLEMKFNAEDYVKWMNGALIQDAMPYLNADDREFLISGCTPEDWDTLFLNNSGE